MRAVAVVLAVLIGAYGLEPGALTTTLLLIMYALARYAAVTGLAWYRFTRRRMVGITPVKLLDDAPRRMRAFQRVTLRIFDLPHHPRRLRQAVRTWREWRANGEALEMNAAANEGVRGDGLANLHDPDDYFSGDKNGGDEGALEGAGAGAETREVRPTRGSNPGPRVPSTPTRRTSCRAPSSARRCTPRWRRARSPGPSRRRRSNAGDVVRAGGARRVRGGRVPGAGAGR